MSDKKLQYCSFCGAHKEKVNKLIVGEEVAICSDCIALCTQLIDDDKKIVAEKTISSKNFDAISIKEHLDRLVIGQDTDKQILATIISVSTILPKI